MGPLDDLRFDQTTGHFFWLISRSRIKAGDLAGSMTTRGYWEISVRGRRYLAHRLVWLLTYGSIPSAEIDHINGNRLDNRVSNLRLATRKQNAANMRCHRDTASGLKGAYYDKRRGKWFSSVNNKFLGYFPDAQSAHVAYCKGAREHFGDFATAGEVA